MCTVEIRSRETGNLVTRVAPVSQEEESRVRRAVSSAEFRRLFNVDDDWDVFIDGLKLGRS